jgi:hypothetical protein
MYMSHERFVQRRRAKNSGLHPSEFSRKTADYLNYPVLTNVRFLRRRQRQFGDTQQPSDKINKKPV